MSETASSKAVILFGHGARDPKWAEPMMHLKSLLLAANSSVRVELAFLELMQPDLESCADTLMTSGINQLTIVPIFFGKGGHLNRDFPPLVQSIQRKYPDAKITATDSVGQWGAVWQAISEEVLKRL